MKKAFLAFFALVLLFCCSSCATDKPDADTSTDTIKAEVNETEMNTEKETEAETKNKLPQKNPGEKIKIACVGDSITYGTGSGNVNTMSYPAQLASILGTKDFEVKNFGKARAFMIDSRDYKDYKYTSDKAMAYKTTQEYQNSLNYDSDIVIICLGANDAYGSNKNKGVDQVRYYYESAIALAREYQALPSKPIVYFMTPPSRFDNSSFRTYVKDTIIPKLHEAAEVVGCDVIDLFTVTDSYAQSKNTNYFNKDGIHLAPSGYTLMAQTVQKAITE